MHNRHKNKSREAHIYTDGSYFQNGNRLGLGWVITREDWRWRTPVIGLKRLFPKGVGSSTIAEIYAVSHALRSTAEGSRVTIFTDDLSLALSMNPKALMARIANTKKPELSKALMDLFNAFSRHECVTGVHMNAKNSPYIEQAHHLARAACALEEKPRKLEHR